MRVQKIVRLAEWILLHDHVSLVKQNCRDLSKTCGVGDGPSVSNGTRAIFRLGDIVWIPEIVAASRHRSLRSLRARLFRRSDRHRIDRNPPAAIRDPLV
jgi:hypothetical protein